MKTIKKVAVFRALGHSSKAIGEFLSLTPEHIRGKYYNELNKMSPAEFLYMFNPEYDELSVYIPEVLAGKKEMVLRG